MPQVWDKQKQEYVNCQAIKVIPTYHLYPNVQIIVNGVIKIVPFGALRNFYTNPER